VAQRKQTIRRALWCILAVATIALGFVVRRGCAHAGTYPFYATEANALQELNQAARIYAEENGSYPATVTDLSEFMDTMGYRRQLASPHGRACRRTVCTLLLGDGPDHVIPYVIDRSGPSPVIACPRHGAEPTQVEFMRDTRENLRLMMSRQNVWK
jgi:hypothetical protein